MQRRKVNTKNKLICSLVFPTALLLLFVSPFSVAAQDEIPPDAAPPPIKQISKAEKAQLDEEPEVKGRTKLSLELMAARVSVAEKYLPQEQFEMVFRELGGFHALVDDALAFLTTTETDKKKVLDNFKRLEMGLRTFTLRLELIRREMPPQREYYIRLLLREMREARAKAVEPLFGNIGIKPSGEPQ